MPGDSYTDHTQPTGTAAAPTAAQPSTRPKSKGKQRSESSNEGTASGSGSGSGSGHDGAGPTPEQGVAPSGAGPSMAGGSGGAAVSSFANLPLPNSSDYNFTLPSTLGPEDTSMRSTAPPPEGEKKTRKQVQNRTAQRRYRGRQAEYVKQLETEIELLKADPSFRETAKDEWIRRLQEDNRQLKAFILGPHRITLTENIDVLLRKSYAIEDGILRPFISSPVIEAAPLMPEGATLPERSSHSYSNDALGVGTSLGDDAVPNLAKRGSDFISNDNFLNHAQGQGAGAGAGLAGPNVAPGNLFLPSTAPGQMPAEAPNATYATDSSTSTMQRANDVSSTAPPHIDQYALRLPPSVAQPPDPSAFTAGMTHFLSSSGMGAGNMGIPWQAHVESHTGATGLDRFATGGNAGHDAISQQQQQQQQQQLMMGIGGDGGDGGRGHGAHSGNGTQQQHSQTSAPFHSGQTLNQQYPSLAGSSIPHDPATGRLHHNESASAGGMVGNRNNSDDANAQGLGASSHASVASSHAGAHGGGNEYQQMQQGHGQHQHQNSTGVSAGMATIFGSAASYQGPGDGPPSAQKRRVGGYLGMNHDQHAESGLPGGQSGGSGGPSPIHVLPAQLYAQREQLSAMIRHVFEAPGQAPVDFSSPDFSYEPYQHRLEPIFRFCWSWAMAIWPDEPEMEVAGMAWIIFLFSNAAVNFYLKLPDFLQPTREQQSLPHEAAVMFVPWKELRNQMVLLDGFVNFRIVGELVNCTCLQVGQYKPDAGPMGGPKPAGAYGAMRHIKELTFFDESFMPFDHLIDIENWRLSRDAIGRFPQLEIPERLIESGDVRKRKEQAWARAKRGHEVLAS